MASVLERLQTWYLSQCDDEWEHGYGVDIGTLDNPGWTIEINLTDTGLAKALFDRIEEGEDDDNFDDDGRQIGPWMVCWVEEEVWHAACGPQSLERALTVFLDWAEKNEKK